MATFKVPTDASIHTSRAFLSINNFFDKTESGACLEFNPTWMHLEPMALTMIAAWGKWCKRNGLALETRNLGKPADYAARMKLFDILGIPYGARITEHEEAGRFLPLRNIKTRLDIQGVIADVSALLHLDQNPNALAAVQYCMSELLRNVLEHSGSEDGAFVGAHNYSGKGPHRVTLAVADCGCGIASHLGRVYHRVRENHLEALRLAMHPGITGAVAGVYGTPDNAGAGLFITRCIAKGTGGYFEIISGKAAYRLRRGLTPDAMRVLYTDPFGDRCDRWVFDKGWQGTVVTLEIRTEKIEEFGGFFSWIREHMPPRTSSRKRIKFT